MANIKFSQFTVGNTESDIDFVVGYKGANNIQISPANLLSATLSGYLPLAGGTMTGTSGIHMPDNFALKAGNSQDLKIYHEGTDSIIQNYTGSIYIDNNADDKDIVFRCDDGSGGLTEYFRLDGGDSITRFTRQARFSDNVEARFGTSGDLRIFHDGFTSYITNSTGDFDITNAANGADLRFRCDDGAGGNATYFQLDGGQSQTRVFKNFKFEDNVKGTFGTGDDLQVYHDGTNSYINNFVGELNIWQNANDKDIVFASDNGSGGIIEYLRLDGSDERLTVNAPNGMLFFDNIKAKFGTSSDIQIYSDNSNSIFDFFNLNNVIFRQHFLDGDMTFQCDNGSGGVTTYFKLDGSNVNVSVARDFLFQDNVIALFGNASDLRIYHNGTNNLIDSINGDISIRQLANDKDIRFRCDDGSGGETEYFRLDGSLATGSRVYTVFPDNSTAVFGSGFDFQIHHDASNTYLQQGGTGDLYFQQNVDNRDIIFQSDDGAGGVTTYFFLDGSSSTIQFYKTIKLYDSAFLYIGDNNDLQFYHNGTNSTIANYTGNLFIANNTDDADISFQCDNGSGSLAEYFRLDGSSVQTIAEKDFRFIDNAKVILGTGSDLQIYHDGGNSLITNTTGDLLIRDDSTIRLQKSNGENMIRAIADGEVELYHNNVKKFDTRTTGIRIAGVSEYADNTAAIAGGLTTGDVYRTGDLLKIVH